MRWATVMTDQPEFVANKRLAFDLRGGPSGPFLVRSDDPSDASRTARMLWDMTMSGVIGRRFDWYEPDGVQRRYQVVRKNVEEGEVIVTCDCVGNA